MAQNVRYKKYKYWACAEEDGELLNKPEDLSLKN